MRPKLTDIPRRSRVMPSPYPPAGCTFAMYLHEDEMTLYCHDLPTLLQRLAAIVAHDPMGTHTATFSLIPQTEARPDLIAPEG